MTSSIHTLIDNALLYFPELSPISREDLAQKSDDLLKLIESKKACNSCQVPENMVLDCSQQLVPQFFCGKFYGIAVSLCRRQIQAQNQIRFKKAIRSSGISERFTSCSLSSYQVCDKNMNGYKKCKVYVDEKKYLTGEGLLITGACGTGKTHMAVAILKDVLKNSMSGIFVSVPDLIAELKGNFGQNQKNAELLKCVTEAEFLVLDDLGAEKSSEWVTEQLYIIINNRYQNSQHATIITTNCSIKQLELRIGHRIVSRIIEMCDGVLLGGPDFREKKRLLR